MSAGKAWEMEVRLEAAIAYLITGNTEDAGKLCNVPGRTIRDWMKTAWWEDVLSEARTIKQKELDALWTGLIHKSTSKLRERLDDGDPILTKAGEIKYLPVKAKDLAIITSIAVDKRALLRGQPTSRTEKVTIEERLDRIGSKLVELDQPSQKETEH